ncbi:MAG TPA: cellulose binding domain-containing protein, partial [Pilimelia sp.]|nr:cellulose binding domain-containing protein [Pilimelia sp.]
TSGPPTGGPPTGGPPTSGPPTGGPPTGGPPTGTPPVPGGACAAAYQTGSSWQGGFQAQVTVAAGAAPINNWTVTWSLAPGQSITQVWNGTLTVTGSTVTVRNVSWNGALAARASAAFGFTAAGTPSAPAVTCTAS